MRLRYYDRFGKNKINLRVYLSKSMMIKTKIILKGLYEKPEPGDGFRILIDRLWPHGLTKEKAQIDLWLKEIVPSTELRK